MRSECLLLLNINFDNSGKECKKAIIFFNEFNKLYFDLHDKIEEENLITYTNLNVFFNIIIILFCMSFFFLQFIVMYTRLSVVKEIRNYYTIASIIVDF